MKAVLFLVVFYLIVASDFVVSDNKQEECVHKKSEKCESKMRESTKKVKEYPLTKELCCPELERRKCLRNAYHDCGQHSRLPQSRYAGCDTYSAKCHSCRNTAGISAAIVAIVSMHMLYILK